jgi:hypothetical protein
MPAKSSRYDAAMTAYDKAAHLIPPRQVRSNLTDEERERLKTYGAVEFTSAGAQRKR